MTILLPNPSLPSSYIAIKKIKTIIYTNSSMASKWPDHQIKCPNLIRQILPWSQRHDSLNTILGSDIGLEKMYIKTNRQINLRILMNKYCWQSDSTKRTKEFSTESRNLMSTINTCNGWWNWRQTILEIPDKSADL